MPFAVPNCPGALPAEPHIAPNPNGARAGGPPHRRTPDWGPPLARRAENQCGRHAQTRGQPGHGPTLRRVTTGGQGVAGKHERPRGKACKMAKDHGSSIKDDKQYEGLRKKGMSKERAARIANDPDSSKKGGKASGSGKRNTDSSQGGTKAQKAAAGRKGGKKSS